MSRICHRMSIAGPASAIIDPKSGKSQGTLNAVPCLGSPCSLWISGPNGEGACGDVIQAAALNAIAQGMIDFIQTMARVRAQITAPPGDPKIN